MIKKGFTLIETVVSITIFSIVLVFLYKSLDLSKQFNKTYSKHLEKHLSKNYLQQLISEDIFETKGTITILTDKNKNNILKIQNTNNTFHYPFNSYVTYLVTKSNKLIRIESAKEFKKDKIDSDFLDDKKTYIDMLAKDIKSFIVLENQQNKNGYSIYINTIDKKNYLFSAKTMIP